MSQESCQAVSTVVVLEPDSSLSRLITLGLEHRGLRVVRITSLSELASRSEREVDLLLLDVDDECATSWSLLENIQADASLSCLPIVVLSWDQPSAAASDQISYQSKPFDARSLYATVDHCLALRMEQKAQQIEQAEALLLASYNTRHASPSVWPIVTAAGLLLSVIGILFQLALLIIGVLIVVIGLLLWTLGAHPSAEKVAGRVALTVSSV